MIQCLSCPAHGILQPMRPSCRSLWNEVSTVGYVSVRVAYQIVSSIEGAP